MLCAEQLCLASVVKCAHTSHCIVLVWSCAVLCDLTPCCLCLVRFDYCRFIELDYVPMETGYMVSMRPTKGYASTKSPTKGYTSTKSPDRHSRSTNSPSTPRSRSVPLLSTISVDSLTHGNDETLCTVNVSWCYSRKQWENCFHSIMSSLTCYSLLLFSLFFPHCISFDECFLKLYHRVCFDFWFLFSSLQSTSSFWKITVSAQRSVCPCLEGTTVVCWHWLFCICNVSVYTCAFLCTRCIGMLVDLD